MGYGDEIIATGLAKGMKERGYLAAFGDGKRIIWGPWCQEMFANNPNIARPGAEQCNKLQWIAHYKGARLYNRLEGNRWRWNYDFKVKQGEFFWSTEEQSSINYSRASLGRFVVVEPNVPWQKSIAPNKDWGEEKYRNLVHMLQLNDVEVVQFAHNNSQVRLRGVTIMKHNNFREAIGTLSCAQLYIGPEGGMHHAAAAVGIPAVVIMGGFIPPAVVGYDAHINLTGGAEACGSLHACAHCRQALQRISVDEVFRCATTLLSFIKCQ